MEAKDKDERHLALAGWDSLSLVARRAGRESREAAAHAVMHHVHALCMFSVILSHLAWPRRAWTAAHLGARCAALRGDSLATALLDRMAWPLELLAMPGFVCVAALNDTAGWHHATINLADSVGLAVELGPRAGRR